MNYYNSRPLTLLSRLAAVSYRLGSLAAKLWLDRKVGDGGGWEKNMESRATEFVEFVQGAGPAFIKIGQGVSIRPDILPEPYLKELVKLQDRVRERGPAFRPLYLIWISTYLWYVFSAFVGSIGRCGFFFHHRVYMDPCQPFSLYLGVAVPRIVHL